MKKENKNWKLESLREKEDMNENPFYRKVTKEEAKWVLSRINQGLEMTRVNPESNYVEARPLTMWENIKHSFGLLN